MRPLTIRFEDDVFDELDILAQVYGMPKNTLVNLVVRAEFDRYASDPKVKKTLEQMKELQNLLLKFANENEPLV